MGPKLQDGSHSYVSSLRGRMGRSSIINECSDILLHFETIERLRGNCDGKIEAKFRSFLTPVKSVGMSKSFFPAADLAMFSMFGRTGAPQQGAPTRGAANFL